MLREWPAWAADGVGSWKGNFAHAAESCSVRCGTADIPGFAFGIGADNEEVGAGFEAAVTGTRGEHGYVSGPDD